MTKPKRLFLITFFLGLAVAMVFPPWRLGCILPNKIPAAPYYVYTGSVCFQGHDPLLDWLVAPFNSNFLGWHPIFNPPSVVEHPTVKREQSEIYYAGAKYEPIIDRGMVYIELCSLLIVFIALPFGADYLHALRMWITKKCRPCE